MDIEQRDEAIAGVRFAYGFLAPLLGPVALGCLLAELLLVPLATHVWSGPWLEFPRASVLTCLYGAMMCGGMWLEMRWGIYLDTRPRDDFGE